MTRQPSKRVTGSGQPLPQSPDSGKADRLEPSSRNSSKLAPLPAPVCKAVAQLASQFRNEHGPQEYSAAERIGRLFKASITPRRPKGRKVSSAVRKAAEMRQDGAEWRAVYAAVLPGFSAMDKYERTCRTSSLRHNVNAYMKRRGLRCGKHGVK